MLESKDKKFITDMLLSILWFIAKMTTLTHPSAKNYTERIFNESKEELLRIRDQLS
jgi:hypothetical protein